MDVTLCDESSYVIFRTVKEIANLHVSKTLSCVFVKTGFRILKLVHEYVLPAFLRPSEFTQICTYAFNS